jgi:hypothetical protein
MNADKQKQKITTANFREEIIGIERQNQNQGPLRNAEASL